MHNWERTHQRVKQSMKNADQSPAQNIFRLGRGKCDDTCRFRRKPVTWLCGNLPRIVANPTAVGCVLEALVMETLCESPPVLGCKCAYHSGEGEAVPGKYLCMYVSCLFCIPIDVVGWSIGLSWVGRSSTGIRLAGIGPLIPFSYFFRFSF